MIYYVDEIVEDEVKCRTPKKSFRSMVKKSVLPFHVKKGDFFECIDNQYRKIAEQMELDLKGEGNDPSKMN